MHLSGIILLFFEDFFKVKTTKADLRRLINYFQKQGKNVFFITNCTNKFLFLRNTVLLSITVDEFHYEIVSENLKTHL